ncbi:MAG: methyltransferase RsmF C-terminal domain-like protein, partial [Leadbetterella sp.]
ENDLLVVNEPIKSRVGILKEVIQKWGYENVIVCNQDPEMFSDLEGFFDVVLVDAPCSGEGLFRKDPNALNEWSVDNVKLCTLRQQRILSAAALLVKPGGTLLYSTCTYNSQENDENVDWLKRVFNFEKVELNTPKEWNIENTKNGYQFLPHKIKGEGFYLSALRQMGRESHYPKARIQLMRLNRNQIEVVKPWISETVWESLEFYSKPDGGVVGIPVNLLPDFGTLHKGLLKRSNGMEIGVLKGKDLIPSHSFAFSSWIHSDVTKTEVSKETALHFLKKENIELPDAKNGWHLITYKNLGLGFGKKIDQRFNNYLPTEWRIRMDLE